VTTETEWSTLKLESPTPVPVIRQCGTCVFFRWATGPTGRRHTREPGDCTWRPPYPAAWPTAYKRAGMSYAKTDSPAMPRPSQMWSAEGDTCECWKAIP